MTEEKTAIKLLQEKFENADLKVKPFTKETEIENDEGDEATIELEQIMVSFPEERGSRSIIFKPDSFIIDVLQSQIEKYKFIKDYEAIWSIDLKVIECEINIGDTVLGLGRTRLFIRRLFRYFNDDNEPSDSNEISIDFPTPKEGITISIGHSSFEFAILHKNQKSNFFFRDELRKPITIRIEGLELTTHKKALNLLQKISNTVFFQIDLVANLPISLVVDRQILRGIKQRKRSSGDHNFTTPKYEYDNEPMALYTYARTSSNMPLLQFLAFYQVMEFYFPLYSYKEAQQQIKNLLKNPLFDTTKDTDIANLINIIKATGKGNTIGDEKNQIKATILNIVNQETLLAFFNETEERKDFFDMQKSAKSLSKHKINLTSAKTDIRIDTALRIYEIRCRIVHSKEESEVELLLPTSSEIKNLKHDLELVEFLAQKAIIAGARPLTL